MRACSETGRPVQLELFGLRPMISAGSQPLSATSAT